MTDVPSTSESVAKRVPWNKGKIVGCQAATSPEARLVHPDEASSRRSDPRSGAINLAIDSKLRGCDVVALKTASAANTDAGEPQTLSHPCSCYGGRMIIIETFERGHTPRTRPAGPIRIDTS